MVSSYLDGSQIYGFNKDRSDSLRLKSNGLLKTSTGVVSPSGDYLPLTFEIGQSDQCSKTNSATKCFVAGDTRTSENLALSGMHTLFMREHNRVAKQLALVNPSWSDDQLFNEARKIVIGIYQHIIYNEWIPATIGNDPNSPDLVPKPLNNYFYGYDPNVRFNLILFKIKKK